MGWGLKSAEDGQESKPRILILQFPAHVDTARSCYYRPARVRPGTYRVLTRCLVRYGHGIERSVGGMSGTEPHHLPHTVATSSRATPRAQPSSSLTMPQGVCVQKCPRSRRAVVVQDELANSAAASCEQTFASASHARDLANSVHCMRHGHESSKNQSRRQPDGR